METDHIRTASEKIKTLTKLAADSYGRRHMVADLNGQNLEEKTYSAFSNELNEQKCNQVCAKVGLGTFASVVGLACRKPGEPCLYARKALDELEKLAGRVAFEVPAVDIDDPEFMQYFGRISRRFGTAVQRFGEHMSDGHLDANEAEDLVEQLRELIAAVAATKRALKQKAKQ